MEKLKKNLAEIKEPGEDTTAGASNDAQMECLDDKDAELRLKEATIQSLNHNMALQTAQIAAMEAQIQEHQRRWQEFMSSQTPPAQQSSDDQTGLADPNLQTARAGRPTDRSAEDQLRNEDRSRERRRLAPDVQEPSS